MTDDQAIQPITLKVPTDCPNPPMFKRIVNRLIKQRFGTKEMAAQCRHAWHETRKVPAPFASNVTAAGYYQSALLALNTRAQQWEAFESEINYEFVDFEEDGDSKEPAIPGWIPEHWIYID